MVDFNIFGRRSLKRLGFCLVFPDFLPLVYLKTFLKPLQFRDADRLISPTFPELNLTAEQIFQAGRSLAKVVN